MQSGMPSRDSLSRSAQDFGMYTTQNTVQRVPVGTRVDKGLPSKESWEGVEKNVHDRLQEAGVLIPDGALVVIAQMGKTVVLLMLLPGQLLFFTFPKWVALELMPVVIKKMHRAFHASLNFAEKILLEPLAKCRTFVEKTFTQFKETVIEKFTKVARAVNEKVELLKESARELSSKVYQTVSIPFKASLSFLKRGVATVSHLTKKVTEALQKKAHQLGEKGSELLDFVKRVAVAPMAQILTHLNHSLKKGVHFLAKRSEALLEKVTVFGQRLKRGFNKLATPIINQSKTFLKFAKGLSKKLQFIERWGSKSALTFKKLTTKIKTLFSQLIEKDMVPESVKNSYSQLMTHNIWVNIITPFTLEGVVGKQLIHFIEWVKRAAFKVGKLKESVLSAAKSLTDFFKKTAKKFMYYGLKVFRLTLEKGKIVFSWVMYLFSFVLKGLKWLLYCVRVFFAVIKVLVYYITQQLRIRKSINRNASTL